MSSGVSRLEFGAEELYVLQTPILEGRSQLLWISPAIFCELSWFLFGKNRGCFLEMVVILCGRCPYMFLKLSIQARYLGGTTTREAGKLLKATIVQQSFIGNLSQHSLHSIEFCRSQQFPKKSRKDPCFWCFFWGWRFVCCPPLFGTSVCIFCWVLDP